MLVLLLYYSHIHFMICFVSHILDICYFSIPLCYLEILCKPCQSEICCIFFYNLFDINSKFYHPYVKNFQFTLRTRCYLKRKSNHLCLHIFAFIKHYRESEGVWDIGLSLLLLKRLDSYLYICVYKLCMQCFSKSLFLGWGSS